MATILAHIKVKAGQERRFEEIVRPLFAGSHHSETALKYYEYWRGQEPRCYYALLAFDDYRGFMVHQTSDHHEAAIPGLTETLEEFRLEWLDPVPGASPLPRTVAQALAADASELAKKYAVMFPVQAPAWWNEI